MFYTYAFTTTAHSVEQTEWKEWKEEDGWGLDIGLGIFKRQLPAQAPPVPLPVAPPAIPTAIPTSIIPGASLADPITDNLDNLDLGSYIGDINNVISGVTPLLPLSNIPPVELQGDAHADANATVIMSGYNMPVDNETTVDNSTQSLSASATPSSTFYNYFMLRNLATTETSTLPLPSGFAAPTAPIPSVLPPLYQMELCLRR